LRCGTSGTFRTAALSVSSFPISTILVDYMLAKMTQIISEMRVFPAPHVAQPGKYARTRVLRPVAAGSCGEGHAARRRYKAVQSNAM
jgi:hypothetical protein